MEMNAQMIEKHTLPYLDEGRGAYASLEKGGVYEIKFFKDGTKKSYTVRLDPKLIKTQGDLKQWCRVMAKSYNSV